VRTPAKLDRFQQSAWKGAQAGIANQTMQSGLQTPRSISQPEVTNILEHSLDPGSVPDQDSSRAQISAGPCQFIAK